MTEFSVSVTTKAVEVSADTAAEAVAKAVQQLSGDLGGNVEAVAVTKLDRIKVAGLNGSR